MADKKPSPRRRKARTSADEGGNVDKDVVRAKRGRKNRAEDGEDGPRRSRALRASQSDVDAVKRPERKLGVHRRNIKIKTDQPLGDETLAARMMEMDRLAKIQQESALCCCCDVL